jgi:predicted  nucleic acid-binding Zn-ribbon protein
MSVDHNKSAIDEEQGIKDRGKKQILIKPKVEVDEGVNDSHQVQILKQQIQTLQQQNQDLEKQHSKLQKKYQKLQRKHQKTCFFLKEII